MKMLLASTRLLVVIAAMQLVTAWQTSRADQVIPVIRFDDWLLTDVIRSISRMQGRYYVLDPRVPGSTVGPGRWLQEPAITVRWENLTQQQAFDRVLASNNLVEVKIPGATYTRIMPANPGSRLIPDSVLATQTNRVVSEAFQDWDLVVLLRTLGKQAGLNLVFDPLLSASALGLEGKVATNCKIDLEHTTSREAITILLENYDLLMVEDPAASSARITVNAHGKTNFLSGAVLAPPTKDGWRTVELGFRMTIPTSWQKELVHPMDSNCGEYKGETAELEFDEDYMYYTAEKARAVIDRLRTKEADPKLLVPGEDIWHLDGRIAHFAVERLTRKSMVSGAFQMLRHCLCLTRTGSAIVHRHFLQE